MIKHQNIKFDNRLKFNLQNGGIVDKDTDILNLFFLDHGNSNSLSLIGNNLEWKPAVWFNFEKENLIKMKEINIVSLLGDLNDFSLYCKKILPYTKINYFRHNLYGQVMPLKITLSNKSQVSNTNTKKHIFHTSIGTARLNRYILIKFAYKNNLILYHPSISLNQSKDFENQISASTGQELQQPVNLEAKRIYDEVLTMTEFHPLHFQQIQDSFLNFVATFPNTDFLKYSVDEKYFDTILAKAVPFFLSHKDSNRDEIETLGFLPYEGFNLAYDNHDNAVIRWQGLLEDNLSFFKSKEKIEELYFKNKKIIDYNFDKLVNTDWMQERKIQYNLLPKVIQEQLDPDIF